MTEMEEILRRTHKLKDSDENNFRIMSQSELMETMSSMMSIMTYLLGAIAAISLSGRRNRHYEYHVCFCYRTYS